MSGIDWMVVGRSPTTVVLEDIQMDVAHQQIVVIPADKASISKDLHRYVNQGLLFRVNPSPAQMSLLAPPPPDPELERLRIRCLGLEEENRRLQEENALLRKLSVPTPDPRLDRILGLLEKGGYPASQEPSAHGLSFHGTTTPGVVAIETAPYIPDTSTKGPLEGQIVVPEKTAEASGVEEAQGMLRRLRSERQ